MRGINRLFSVIGFCIITTLITAGLSATMILLLSTEQKIKRSNFILQGRFLSERLENARVGKLRLYEFQIEQAYKGKLQGTIAVTLTTALRLGSLPLNKEVVVFLSKQEGNRYSVVGIHQGILPVMVNPATGKKEIILRKDDPLSSPGANNTAGQKSLSTTSLGKKNRLSADEFQSLIDQVEHTQ